MKKYSRVLVLLNNALRLDDNATWYHATQEAEEVVPVVCIPRRSLDANRSLWNKFFCEAILDIHARMKKMNMQLLIRVGSVPEGVLATSIAYKVGAVFVSEAHDPDGISEQRKLQRILRAVGISLEVFHDHTLFTPDEIRTTQGNPYTVFTPFSKRALEHLEAASKTLVSISRCRTVHPVDESQIERYVPLHGMKRNHGETNARALLRNFIECKMERYATTRDELGVDGTSRLSHHLAFGTISIRTIVRAVLDAKESRSQEGKRNAEVFLKELLWREFYWHIFIHFPHVVERSFHAKYDALEWRGKEAHLRAWQNGRTGFPIVDATMRQLNVEGWMHNRARMIAASFLTKDLHIHWKEGEKYFYDRLIDADVASNNGGWQWVAGTGTDASPWFRIFNPILQSKKFDATGSFIRSYVPELRSVPDAFIHEPWKMTRAEQMNYQCAIGKHYPHPIIEHAKEKEATMHFFRRVALRK